MGAELIIAWCDEAHDANGNVIEDSFDVRAELKRRIMALDDTVLSECAELKYGESPTTVGEMIDGAWTTRPRTADEEAEWAESFFGDEFDDWRGAIQGDLMVACDVLFPPYRRNIVPFNVHGNRVLFGGGETWGDTPDGHDEVMLIGTSGITEEAI